MSIRWLAVFARQLLQDPRSALLQAVAPTVAAWGPGEYLLADLFDTYRAVHFQDPKPYPRPGDAEREQARIDARRAALEAQAQRIKAREAT